MKQTLDVTVCQMDLYEILLVPLFLLFVIDNRAILCHMCRPVLHLNYAFVAIVLVLSLLVNLRQRLRFLPQRHDSTSIE